MKKIYKYIITILSIILIAIIVTFGFKTYKLYQIKHAKKLVELKTNEVLVFEDIYLKDIIKNINGKIIDNKKIDTTKVGKKKIKFEYITDKKIKVPYTIEINVKDTTPPLIKTFSRYTIYVGNDNFYENFFCGDNYDDTPKCTIEGEYDYNTPGEYNVTFKAEDSSKNISENNFTLIVKEKPTEQKEEKKEEEVQEEIRTNYNEVIQKYKNDNTKIGIDISQFQGDIDFEKVKEAGVEFVYIRVGRGGGIGNTPVLDKKFKQNIKGFNKVGIPVGIYFFSYAVNKKEVKKDAKWVVKQLKKYKVDLEVAYDFEDWKDYKEYNLSFYNLTENANTFNNYMKEHGYNGMLYSSKYYLENIWFKQKYPVWLAHYTEQTDYTVEYKVWQICEDGKIEGINSKVDIDIMYN